MELSIVVPVYKEEGNLSEFLRQLTPILKSVTEEFEIIFALDPSPDRSEEIILEQRKRDPRIKLLVFSRRFGQPMATLAGLQYSTGRAVIVMDADLQDPPETIPRMVGKWKEGYDVVLAQRRTRGGETWVKRAVSAAGYKAIELLSDVPIPRNTGDFRLMSRRVTDEVCRLRETHGFLRGMVAVVGWRQAVIEFDRPPRFSGAGNYNRFFGSVRIGMNGIVCFSNKPLLLSTLSGSVAISVAVVSAAIYAVMKQSGSPLTLEAPVIAMLILFMGGIQLVSVGILGSYVGRIYDDVKQRPRFIVDREIGFERPHSARNMNDSPTR